MAILAIVALFIINLVFVYSFHLQTKEWQKERKDLYDRIMSKDLQEYKWNTEETKVYAPVSNDDDELYEREIEDNKV